MSFPLTHRVIQQGCPSCHQHSFTHPTCSSWEKEQQAHWATKKPRLSHVVRVSNLAFGGRVRTRQMSGSTTTRRGKVLISSHLRAGETTRCDAESIVETKALRKDHNSAMNTSIHPVYPNTCNSGWWWLVKALFKNSYKCLLVVTGSTTNPNHGAPDPAKLVTQLQRNSLNLGVHALRFISTN